MRDFHEALRLAHVDLAEGKVDAASTAYEHAHALALQLGDPCWEGLAARGLGLVSAHQGDAAAALHWIGDLEALATRTGMRELVARAYAHRGKLGDRVAVDAARVLAAEVDNPSLRCLE